MPFLFLILIRVNSDPNTTVWKRTYICMKILSHYVDLELFKWQMISNNCLIDKQYRMTWSGKWHIPWKYHCILTCKVCKEVRFPVTFTQGYIFFLIWSPRGTWAGHGKKRIKEEGKIEQQQQKTIGNRVFPFYFQI